MKRGKLVYVTAYEVERCYGGCEEGGWWFNAFSPIELFITTKGKAEKFRERLLHKLDKKGIWRNENIYSVNGGMALEVFIESKPWEIETLERPHYE